MPAYKFEALDADGRSKSGLMEADNAKAARAQLRAQSLVPLEVAPVSQAANDAQASRFSRRVFTSTTLAVWTRQMAGLVGSGLPLERSLTALMEDCEDARQRELIAHLRSEVNAGNTFARALGTVSREFDDVYRAVVAAGEQSGALGPVLERLADDLETQQALKSKLIGAETVSQGFGLERVLGQIAARAAVRDDEGAGGFGAEVEGRGEGERRGDQEWFHGEIELLFVRLPRVIALNTIVSRQQTIMVPKTPPQPQWSAIQPTPVPAIAEPNT